MGVQKKGQRITVTCILMVLAWVCGYGSAIGGRGSDQLHALTPGKASAATVKDSLKPETVRLAAADVNQIDPNGAAAARVEPKAAEPSSPAKIVKKAATKPAPVRTVMLTFDDGPDGKYTPQILAILKKNNVKATFFVVGTQVKKYPKTLKQIVDEGNAIGNHTYHHADLTKKSKAGIIQEIETNDVLIKRAIGYTPTLFRAPYGALSPTLRSVLKDEHRELVGWNVDTRDWAGNSVATMRTMIQNKTKSGSIILMHCFGSKYLEHTVELLPLIIKDLKSKGYSFVTVS